MTRITLFTSTIGGDPSRLTVSVTRNFASRDPFTIMLGSDSWPLTTPDAERLSAAGRRIEGTFDFCGQRNEPVTEAPYFRRQLGNANGRAATFEIGIAADGPIAGVYLEWSGRRIVDSSRRLLKMLSVLGEATATIRQAAASRVQDVRINPETFRSPFGWDGR